MKHDSDSSVLHPTVVQLPNAKHLQHGDDILDLTKPKAVKKIIKEKQDVILHENKGSQLIAVSVPSDLKDEDGFWPVADFDSSDTCQNLTNGRNSEIVKVTEGDVFRETELLKEDLNIFTDKNITDYELPEVVVCCKGESDFNEIRDICVDEGMVSNEKILFETEGDSDLEPVLLPDKEATGSMTKEISEINCSVSDIPKVPEDHCPMESVGKCWTEHLVLAENSATEDLQHNSSANQSNEAEEQSGKVLRDELSAESNSTLNAGEDTKDSYEEVAKDSSTIRVEPSLPETCEVECGGNEAISEKNELPYSSQVESGNITFSFAATTPTPSDGHESLCDETKESPDNQEAPRVHEGHAFSGRDLHSHGETSFSVLAGPPSGLISYSGQIAYSGSLSLRSDSSIGTSTRSFAFPVMQSDWNTSPVRMAKADRRKHFGWRRGLLCCKF